MSWCNKLLDEGLGKLCLICSSLLSTIGPVLSPCCWVAVPPRQAICCRQRCRWPRVPPALSRKPGLSLLRSPVLWDYWALASGAQIASRNLCIPSCFNLIFVLLGRRQSFVENINGVWLGGWHELEVCAQAGGVSLYQKSVVGAGCGPQPSPVAPSQQSISMWVCPHRRAYLSITERLACQTTETWCHRAP